MAVVVTDRVVVEMMGRVTVVVRPVPVSVSVTVAVVVPREVAVVVCSWVLVRVAVAVKTLVRVDVCPGGLETTVMKKVVVAVDARVAVSPRYTVDTPGGAAVVATT